MIIIGILLLIGGIFFPPLLIIAIPVLLFAMIKSGFRRGKRGMEDWKIASENFKEIGENIRKEKTRKANSKVHAHNRTEADEQNLARIRAELAKDKEEKKNRKADK
jgi:uncharacterized membrane protein YbaN (DUF454 family)